MKTRDKALVSVFLGLAIFLFVLPDASFNFALQAFSSDAGRCPLGYGDVTATSLGHTALHANLENVPKFKVTSTSSTVTVYHNCKVYTGQRNQQLAEAFAVGDNRKFFAVGSINDVYNALLKAQSTHVETVDLDGAYVTPGLVDTHLHLISGGLSLHRLDLRQVANKQDFIHAVHAAVNAASPGDWIQGANWDESKWSSGGATGETVPSAKWIDEISPVNPIFLTRMDAHQALVNSYAMKLANITAETPDPPGGVITRDVVSKQPTGLLSDAAMSLVSSVIPLKTIEQRKSGFWAAQEHLLSLGITSVHDMGRIAFLEGEEAAWEDLEEVYLPAADDGSLKIRINAFVPLPTWRRLAERVKHVGTSHPGGKLQWGGVKEFYDGSLGSRTALMWQPYTDSTQVNISGKENEKLIGTRTVDLVVFQRQIQGAHAAGLQIAVHAIGDRAVDELLEAYAALETIENTDANDDNDNNNNTVKKLRHRIEHAQHTSNSAAVRSKMAELGIVATPNPLHLLADLNILEPRLGKERAEQGAYAFKTLCSSASVGENVESDNGTASNTPIMCAFASDWPVVPLNPALTLRAASVQSREESISPEEAFLGITSSAAFVGHRENEVGSIVPGLLADFVVFNSEIMDGTLGHADVRQTFIDGVCVYGCQEEGEAVVDGGDGDFFKDEL